MFKILALDQATHTSGYAVTGEPPLYGICKGPSKLTGAAAQDWQVEAVRDLIKQHNPTHVSLEGVHADKRNLSTVIMLGLLRGRLYQVVRDHGLPVIDVSSVEVQTWVGLGSYAKHDIKKARTRFWSTCEIYGEGFVMANDESDWIEENMADAIVNLRIAEHKLRQGLLLETID